MFPLGVSSFSECLNFSYEFLQNFICPNNVILLSVSEVCLPRTPMSFFPLSLEIEPSESVILHLSVAYDETPRLITICNDDYKFSTFSDSILHEFAVINEVTSMFNPETFSVQVPIGF